MSENTERVFCPWCRSDKCFKECAEESDFKKYKEPSSCKAEVTTRMHFEGCQEVEMIDGINFCCGCAWDEHDKAFDDFCNQCKIYHNYFCNYPRCFEKDDLNYIDEKCNWFDLYCQRHYDKIWKERYETKHNIKIKDEINLLKSKKLEHYIT